MDHLGDADKYITHGFRWAGKYRVEFRIDALPKMANGSHGTWMTVASNRRKWHQRVAKELIGRTPPGPLEVIYARLTRHSSRAPDYDGLVHGFKPIVDALVKYGVVIDDRMENVKADYQWEYKKGKGHITVEISGEPLLPLKKS